MHDKYLTVKCLDLPLDKVLLISKVITRLLLITREPLPVKGLAFLTERKDVFLEPYVFYNALPMFAQWIRACASVYSVYKAVHRFKDLRPCLLAQE